MDGESRLNGPAPWVQAEGQRIPSKCPPEFAVSGDRRGVEEADVTRFVHNGETPPRE
jgi:hypothetical protein